MPSDLSGARPARRVRVGRGLRLIAELPDGLELEGLVRLPPGHIVEVTDERGVVRRVLVASWVIARLEREGPIYRGQCRWAV